MPKFIIPSEDKFFSKFSIALILLILVILIGTITFHDSDSTYSDSFIETIELISHVEAHNIDKKTTSIVLSLVGYLLQFYLLYVLLEFTLDGKLRNLFSEVKMLKKVNKMKNHYIICGGGRVGQHVADELIKAKKDYIIAENDEKQFKYLKNRNYNVLNLDILDEKEFEKTNIKNASWVMACLGDDGDNILMILTSKELNANVKIAARANYERIIPKLKHAGAIHIVCPKALGGTKLAQAVLSEHISPALNLDVKKKLKPTEYGIDLD